MSFFGLLLAVILGYFIFKFLRLVFGVSKVVNQQRKAYRDFVNQFGGNASNGADGTRRRQPEQPAPRAKKIDPNVGEYVEYEEVACDVKTTTSTTTSETYVREQQVVDAEWEEIK